MPSWVVLHDFYRVLSLLNMMRTLKDPLCIMKAKGIIARWYSRRIQLHPKLYPFLRKLYLSARSLPTRFVQPEFSTHTGPIGTFETIKNGFVTGSIYMNANSWLRLVGSVKPLYNFRFGNNGKSKF